MKTIEERIEASYPEFGPQLRRAARFVLRSPADIALYPLRRVAERASVGPTTLIRLAEHLGFTSYREFRDSFRERLRSGIDRYVTDAEQLVREPAADRLEQLHRATGTTHIRNLEQTFASISAKQVEAACDALVRARNVYILGLRANFAPAFYFYYVLRTFARNVFLLEGRLGMLIDEIGEIGPKDAFLVLSGEPYGLDAVKAANYAAAAGATIIALTDTPVSPVARSAAHVFITPNASTSFYQSMVPKMALLECFVSIIAARQGRKVVGRVRREFERREKFGVYWRED